MARLVYQFTQSKFAPSFLDEALVVVVGLMAPAGSYYLFKDELGRKILLSIIAYISIILLSSLIFKYSFERGSWAFYKSFLLDLKFFIFFLGAAALALRSERRGGLRRVVRLIMLSLVLVALVDSVQVLRDIMGNGIGFDGEPLATRGAFFRPNGFFHHPVQSAQVALFGFLSALGFLARRLTTGRLALAVYLFLILIFHVSVKEIIVGCLFLLMFVMIFVRTNAFTKALAVLLGVSAIGSVFASSAGGEVTSRISYYTSEQGSDTVRRALYRGGYEIALDLFPLGAGAGTFGSEGSRTDGYSSLYFKYGIYGRWGANRQNDTYLLDTFWPKVMGESGIAGLGAMLSIIYLMISCSWRVMRRTRAPEDFVALSAVMGVIIISVATAALNEELNGAIFFLFAAIAFARSRAVDPKRSGKSVRSTSRPTSRSHGQ
ncbi:hypothetical protein KNJ79_06590 [Sphingopyxis indica]|uniref:hypothetical protein n=1 Tax=Sphingopyxis indica TaxID=436663 RepID=UPI00293936EF|nr:hypothetical protein [Sphingopyxis indica]WOF44583.1 hypothetical protein KNJ79_06590 [Sphingopyxis indica]